MCNFWDNTKQRFLETRHSFCSKNKLFILRLIGFLICFQSQLTHFIIRGNKWAFSFAYLTIHGAIFAQLAFFFLLLSHCCRFIRLRPCCWKFTHVLFEFALTLSIPIALMYWLALFPELVHDDEYWEDNSMFNQIQLHSFILIMLVLEYLFDALQLYRSHVVLLLIYAVGYILINVIVTLEVRIVYKIMTWRDYMSFVWAGITLVLLLITFYLLVWIGKNKKGIQDDEGEGNQLKEDGTYGKNSDQIYY